MKRDQPQEQRTVKPIGDFTVSMSWVIPGCDRQRQDVVRRRDLGPRPLRELPVVDGARIALDFFQSPVAADRHDLARRAAMLGHDSLRGFAQSVRHAMLAETCGLNLLVEPMIESVAGEWPTPLVREEREGGFRARASLDRCCEFCRHRALDRDRPALAVLLLGEDQPSVFEMLAAERNGIASASGHGEPSRSIYSRSICASGALPIGGFEKPASSVRRSALVLSL